MAQVVLIPVAKQILGKVTDLASVEIGLVWNFNGELEKLKDTVSTIQAVLLDAEEKQVHSHQVKDWLEKLSEVMYDADDLLDDVSIEAARRRREDAADDDDDDDDGRRTVAATCWSVVRFLVSSLLPKQLLYTRKMAREIKAIREKLDVISKDKVNFMLEVRNEQALVPFPSRETDSCPPTVVIGREVDKRKIIQLLLDCSCEDSSFVVPIVGIGGLGKTTLAQLVFADERIEEHFEIKIWVHVSQKFDIKGILGRILLSIGGECRQELTLDVLKNKIHKEFRSKRFLLALDDVWEENVESWEDLGKYLKVGAFGSKVLVTTRSKEVAELSSRVLKLERSSMVVLPYFLEGLSLDEAWSLMVEKALHGKDHQNPDVERIGKEILRKCCGVPLAVSTIAGLLRSKDPETEWLLFSKNDLSSISEEKNLTMSTLRLSFNHLPSHLKRCFTYCKLFPKGCELYVKPLIQLWIAQGYIESGDEGSEDMGLHCFKMLWWRSFFQEVKMDKLGNIETCKIHDLVHDLVTSLTGAKILKLSGSSALKNISSKTSHLAVMRGTRVAAGDLREASKLRTFMCRIRIEESKEILSYFRFLRVLVISVEGREEETRTFWWKFFCRILAVDNRLASKLLNSLGESKHLRFLRFSCRRMTKLPDSVTDLVAMQVLDLSRCSYLTELPRDIGKLVNLKHLYLDPYVNLTHMPKGIGELTSLQTLKKFVVGKKTSGNVGELDELKGLIALRGELTIESLSNAVAVGAYVLKKQLYLQFLVLKWNEWHDYGDSSSTTKDEEILEKLCPHSNLKKLEIHHYGGLKLPNWLSSITNLVGISLAGCWRCEHLPALHKLPSLKKLHIRKCRNLKAIGIEKAEEEWPCFPCLSHLEIIDCPNLTRMPLFPTVEQKLSLRRTSSQALVRTMKTKVAPDTVECMSSSSRPPLSKLTHLRLEGIDDLESLPAEGFRNLTSLQELFIFDCPRLASLPQAVQHLPSLQTSNIYGCPQLTTERYKKDQDEDKIILDFQKTSKGPACDLWCPNCSGQITKQVILRPKVPHRQQPMFP